MQALREHLFNGGILHLQVLPSHAGNVGIAIYEIIGGLAVDHLDNGLQGGLLDRHVEQDGSRSLRLHGPGGEGEREQQGHKRNRSEASAQDLCGG